MGEQRENADGKGGARRLPEPCDGDHAEPFDAADPADREQFGEMVEGICPTCHKPSERLDDGFARCPCCRNEWALRPPHVIVRFDVSAFLAAVADA